MVNKTLTGLEAVLLMQEGGYITDGQHIYRFVNTKIEASDITSFNKGKPKWKSGNVFNFNYDQYKQYTQPSQSGWERVEEGDLYLTIDEEGLIYETTEDCHDMDDDRYNIANYFSTKEKAEEINFKQTLFRKLQRFSDENGGTEIDWNDEDQTKFSIKYSHWSSKLSIDFYNTVQQFVQVYFASKEVARRAIELFHDDLIKYFTM